MPIPKATPEVCDKPADDYAYALMIGCIQSGFSFLGPSWSRMKPWRARRPPRLRTKPGDGTERVSRGFTIGWAGPGGRLAQQTVQRTRDGASDARRWHRASHPIITTKEAYDALMEAGHALANPAWQAALDAIVRALLDPTPENVEAGRIAFDRLHHPHPSGSSQPRRA